MIGLMFILRSPSPGGTHDPGGIRALLLVKNASAFRSPLESVQRGKTAGTGIYLMFHIRSGGALIHLNRWPLSASIDLDRAAPELLDLRERAPENAFLQPGLRLLHRNAGRTSGSVTRSFGSYATDRRRPSTVMTDLFALTTSSSVGKRKSTPSFRFEALPTLAQQKRRHSY